METKFQQEESQGTPGRTRAPCSVPCRSIAVQEISFRFRVRAGRQVDQEGRRASRSALFTLQLLRIFVGVVPLTSSHNLRYI